MIEEVPAELERVMVEDAADRVGSPSMIQESLYRFPYHHIPSKSGDVWSIGRNLFWGFRYMAVIEKMVEIISSIRPQVVLDVGCGDGRIAKELLAAGVSRVIGVDTSERALLFARAFNFGQNCQWHTDLSEVALPLVDAIVAIDVLEHIPDQELPELVTRLADKLPHGGLLVASVPTWNLPLSSKHYRHYDLKGLREQLGEHFVVGTVSYIHRLGLLSNIIQAFVTNRFYTLNSRTCLKFAKRVYDRFVRTADDLHAGQLLVAFEKRSSSTFNPM